MNLISDVSKLIHFLQCVYIAPDDFIAITETFTFNETQSQDCATITISQDSFVENSEKFTGNLDVSASRTALSPDVLEIIIQDDDRKCEKFEYPVRGICIYLHPYNIIH